VTTVLIGTNITHLTIASMVTVIVIKNWGDAAVSIGTLVTTLVVFFTGEMLPKSIAKRYCEPLALATASSLLFFMKILTPVSFVLTKIGQGAAKLFGAQEEVSVTEEAFLAVLEKFRGKIQQVPPMYSALKVNGQKLCDLARKGKEVERQPREIEILELTCLEFTGNTARLRVRCSKGTYIRTLCKDIGEALGCGGCMQQLRRVQAGEYTIWEAVPLQELLETENPESYLRGVDTMFRGYPEVKLTPNQEKRCRNGNAFSVKLADGTYRAYSQSGEFLMLAKVEDGTMSTVKSFFDV
jgi:tRNA pseudouridine55 synthase